MAPPQNLTRLLHNIASYAGYCVSWTLLLLARTQSTFLKFFRCSRFSEFDSKYFRSINQNTTVVACKQALLFGRAKRASRERASKGQRKGDLSSAPRGFAYRSRVLARLASFAQVGELALLAGYYSCSVILTQPQILFWKPGLFHSGIWLTKQVKHHRRRMNSVGSQRTTNYQSKYKNRVHFTSTTSPNMLNSTRVLKYKALLQKQ